MSDGDEELDLDGWQLEVIRSMEDPPAEAFETSWRQAKDILEDAGPESAILLLTVRMDGDDLSSKVVLSSGYQEIPTSYIREILRAHLGAMGNESGEGLDEA